MAQPVTTPWPDSSGIARTAPNGEPEGLIGITNVTSSAPAAAEVAATTATGALLEGTLADE